MRDSTRRGFTLVELLVVIAIIGTLVALLLPAVQAAREAARRSQCSNNLKQFGLAVQNYISGNEYYPDGYWQTYRGTYKGVSFFVPLLPFMEQQNIYDLWDYPQLKQGEFYHLKAKLLTPESPAAADINSFHCPSDTPEERVIYFKTSPGGSGMLYPGYYSNTSYAGNYGTRNYYSNQSIPDGIFFLTGPESFPEDDQEPAKLSQVADGTSNTFLMGERYNFDPIFDTIDEHHRNGLLIHQWSLWGWTGGYKGNAHLTRSSFQPINTVVPPSCQGASNYDCQDDRLMGWGSGHPGGATIGLADGSTRFVSDSISTIALAAYGTRDGGEIVSE